tara:strand:- start:95 stop:241 length:147 start_codon:yes stop_codon:yes gene_type:complete
MEEAVVLVVAVLVRTVTLVVRELELLTQVVVAVDLAEVVIMVELVVQV